MASSSPHGRRRKPTTAIMALPASRTAATRTPRHASASGMTWSRGKQVTAATTLGVATVLTVALTAAHANPAPTATTEQVAASAATAAPVQASAGASISFERPGVTTKAAPPAKAPVAAAGAVAAPKAASTSPAASSGRLGAPLASMSIASPFGIRTSPITGTGELHTGQDLVAACQTAVFAAGAGTVVEAGWSPYGGGNRIVVDHGNGLKSTYNHLAAIETAVGATVGAGQRIAAAGTTGNSTGCHLHFEVLLNGQTVNPQGWL
ncbi:MULTISPECIES: M23 family metallopeptidase [Paenarthrobacter]|uniref:M23 family metallopeptidase n=1 Tax=Paenarthrobacter ureafaciens TaxID=37931 RepID=A0AAX3EP29_PAEUR|nr:MULTISPECIES: M23 family metallopeptidase [Paenarthrobacter]MCW3767320.1 M23 family metallopeptidase [Paenarthrobacter sp. PAE-2]MDO5866894.1 M23 family metallopeptidase [Paenarthrobacter sp. SD-2]MDO5878062.1 M23 family metallopeptidase [Paenarthrobacter sp. SD-1]UYV95404.1 M23 family metallopeptidase [Paenarthrobacter ureafaciens]UYV99912.1 M23 family metallopeptidase [Paenarthrobacter ureafaciens]